MDADLAPWEERWVWLIGSLLLACLVSWIGWAIRHMGGRPQAWVTRWQRWPGRPWINHTLRLLYAVGIPAAALLWRGALKESALGLQPFPWQHGAPVTTALPATWENWLRDALWVLGLGVGIAGFVGLATSALKRAGISVPTVPRDAAVSLREAVIHEVHWTFYREPFILLWGAEIGVWAGLLLAFLEAAVNPARWADLRSPAASRELLLRAALAVTSALLFLQTQNLWLALLTHALLGWLWGMAERAPQGQEITRECAEP